jgi:hypothetical protein
MQGGTDPEDEDSDAGMAERTRAYQPDPYKDDTSASDSSPVKRECAITRDTLSPHPREATKNEISESLVST